MHQIVCPCFKAVTLKAWCIQHYKKNFHRIQPSTLQVSLQREKIFSLATLKYTVRKSGKSFSISYTNKIKVPVRDIQHKHNFY